MATERVTPIGPAQDDAAAVTRALLDVLGERLVAVIAGVDSAQTVREWACGDRLPPPVVQRRLLETLEIVQLLSEWEGPETIRAWWIGMNPDLGDEAPALVLGRDPAGVRSAALAYLTL